MKEKIYQMLDDLRTEVLKSRANSRERSLVITKIDEAELWLTRCEEVSNG